MNKTIIFVIVFIVLIGGLLLIYFLVEKPIQKENFEFHNLTIFAKNQDGKFVRTGYEIYTEDILYSSGITNEYGGVPDMITTNKTFSIQNKNIDNQTNYITKQNIVLNKDSNFTRITIDVRERGLLEINQIGEFGYDKKINLTLSTNKSFESFIYCFKWSTFIVFVKSENATKVETIDNNDKCYSSQISINKTKDFTINILYEFLTQLKGGEYIKVSFYDFEDEEYIKRQEYEIKY